MKLNKYLTTYYVPLVPAIIKAGKIKAEEVL